MIELATNFFCLNEERKGHRTVSQPIGRDNYNQLGAVLPLAPPSARRASLWSARAHTGCHLCTLGSKGVQHPPPAVKAGELLTGYNWSLVWSLSASGLTVWPGEGAWGGWATGGRPWDRDMALGTIPSTAAGMPVGATLTTPGGYLLGEEGRHVRSLETHLLHSPFCMVINDPEVQKSWRQ